MKTFVAADIGYSNLKMAWLSVPDNTKNPISVLFRGIKDSRSDDPEERENSSLVTKIFPAGASPVADLADTRASDLSGHTIMLDGKEWRAPIDFADTQVNRRDFSNLYVKSDEWLALLRGTLAEAAVSEVDTLVLGLPSSEFYDEETNLKDYVKTRALGVHPIRDDFSVEVKNVEVVPQPLGTFYGQLLSCKTPEEVELLNESLVLVCDPGYYSFDFILIQGGNRIYKDSSISTPNSVKEVCDRLRVRIKNDKAVNLQDGRIEAALRQGKKYVFAGGKKISFEAELKEIAGRVANATLSEIRSSLHSKGYEPDIAILSGGGAEIFKEFIKEGTGVNRVDTAENPVMMNVVGYLRAAF